MLLRLCLTALALTSCLHVAPTRAAQDFESCTGYIDALPASIGTQGTWCLRTHLSTSQSSGNAIEINSNNVTIDCNDFRITGDLSGSAGAVAITAANRVNTVVRRCDIRGFLHGIALSGMQGGNHVVENNRLHGVRGTGILVEGDDSLISKNQVRTTGGSIAVKGYAYGISTRGSADVQDNLIDGVEPTLDDEHFHNGTSIGIQTADHQGSSITGNRVRNIRNPADASAAEHLAVGILIRGTQAIVRGNQVMGNGTLVNAAGGAIGCDSSTSVLLDNVVGGYPAGAMPGCTDGGTNVSP